jgi:hypothetical protein
MKYKSKDRKLDKKYYIIKDQHTRINIFKLDLLDLGHPKLHVHKKLIKICIWMEISFELGIQLRLKLIII